MRGLSVLNGNIRFAPPFYFCSPHFPSPLLSTRAEPGRSVRPALPWPRALPTAVLSGRKNTHVAQQQGSPLLRPDGPASAHPSPKQLLLCHGDERYRSDTHTAGGRRTRPPSFAKAIMKMSLVACRLVSWSLPHQTMKQPAETCTSGSNLEGSSSAAPSPTSLLLLQHTALPLSPCCLVAWLCTVWAQSMSWETSWRRGQTPVSPVPANGYQHLLSSSLTTKQLRLAGVWLLMAPGEELHHAQHTPTILLSLQFTGMSDLPKFKCLPPACLFFNSWVTFPKSLKTEMALLCRWIVMLPGELKAQHATYTVLLLLSSRLWHYFQHIIYSTVVINDFQD